MKVYLDARCLNRPFDDQMQTRVRLESEAVFIILRRCESGEWQLIGSEALDFEISRIPDEQRKEKVSSLNGLCTVKLLSTKRIEERAANLVQLGISPMDALHLACAEAGNVDAMLTTDDKLLQKTAKKETGIKVKVENPIFWLAEVSKNENRHNDSQ